MTLPVIISISSILFCYYAGNIIYDLFIKKAPEDFAPKQEDEDVDISDEARQFHPIPVTREPKKEQVQVAQPIFEEEDKKAEKNTTGFNDDMPNRKSLSEKGKADSDNSGEASSEDELKLLEELKRGSEERMRKFREDTGIKKEETTDNGDAEYRKGSVVQPPDDKTGEDENSTSESSEQEQILSPKQADSKNEIPQLDDDGPIPNFRIKEHAIREASQTRINDGQTAERLQSEAQKAIDDPILMSRKVIENGWKLIRKDDTPDEEDILDAPELDDDDGLPSLKSRQR